MGRKRWVALLAVVLLFAAGCGAGGPRPNPGAHIVIVLRADGGGRVDFWAGGGVRTDRALRDLGTQVAAALFHGKALRPTTVEPGNAFVYARTEVPEAYRRGSRPVFDVAGRSVAPVLRAAGYRDYTLVIRLPRVRTSIGSRTRSPGSDYSWKVSASGPPPAGVIVMHPRMVHWTVEMALLAIALVGVLTAFAVRDRRTAFAGCVAALVTAATVLVSDAGSAEALGTLGRLSGTTLALVTRLPFAALPLLLLAMVRLVILFTAPAVRTGSG